MEKIEILYSPRTEKYLTHLINILYEKEYFSYLDSAKQYVSLIKINFETAIQLNQYKPTPELLSKHGNFYIAYNANKRTAWYAFFVKKDNKFLVRYITNSHSKDASLLNK